MTETATTENMTAAERESYNYDTFRELAVRWGLPKGVSVVEMLRRAAPEVTDADMGRWIRRYEQETNTVPHAPTYPIDEEYAAMFDRYQALRAS